MKFQTQHWHDDHASVRVGTYPDGSPKMTVLDRYKRILCDVTVSLDDMGEYPAPGHVFVRDYGDGEGVLRCLQNAGVLGRTKRIIETGVHTRDPLLRRAVHEVPLLTTNV